jgi:acyl carrier protein
MKIKDIIQASINSFNLITPQKKITNVEKFKLSLKYDSLDLMNLSIAFEENFQQQGKYIDFSKKNLKKIFKDYKSIYNFLKKNEKKN